MDQSVIWDIIQSFFDNDPKCLVRHHIDSYNDFFTSGIYKIFKEKNPIRIQSRYDPNLARYDASTEKLNPELGFGEYRSQALLWMGGKDGSRIYFGKPIIYDDSRQHYMYPNEARLRNMTYAMTIHYDVEVEYIDILEEGEGVRAVAPEGVRLTESDEEEDEGEYENFKKNGGDGNVVGEATAGEATAGEATAGEATAGEATAGEATAGGAGPATKKPFKKLKVKRGTITVKETGEMRELTEKSMVSKNVQKTTSIMEKVFLGKFPIMVQSDFCILGELEKDVRFRLGECRNDLGGYFIIDGKEKVIIPQEKFADNLLDVRKESDDLFLFSANIRSVSENVSKPIRTLSVKLVAPNSKYSNLNIVVSVPNVRKPVPLFILFRALGILSDKNVITTCIHDLDKYEPLVDLFIPSIHEAGGIMTQKAAIEFIAVLTKGKTTETVLEILADFFLPHIGEMNFTQKAYFLGYMVFRLLKVHTGIDQETNRDNYKFKRVETPGLIIADLFREAYTLQQKDIKLWYEKVLFFNQDIYERNLKSLITDHREFFSNRLVESWFKKGFKGNWGTQQHTKRIGVLQDMNRLSHNTMLSHLRKTNLPLDSSVKLVGPRLLHASQWGFFDPIDTPDGANIGLHKHMSISATITKGFSREPVVDWLRKKTKLKFIEECVPVLLAQDTKVFVNGYWAGMVEDPYYCVNYIKLFRRNGLLPTHMSVSFDIKQNIIHIYTDEGRLTRPIFYKDADTGFFFENAEILKKLEAGFTWQELSTGFNKKHDEYNPMRMYELFDLYDDVGTNVNPAKFERFIKNKAIIDYIDTSESEDVLIAMDPATLQSGENYTHLEIHPSLTFGVMCNLIPYPQNNPATRNSFSCGQSKQAVSLYHTNYQVRMDKSAVVLATPQIPLIKSRYMNVINGEENCYGENAIVAIMCYTGYNMEDAVLINEGALKRGLFRTTYYTTYETHEEKVVSQDGRVESEKIFTNIENMPNIIGTKPGYEYNHLDEYGLVKEGTEVNDKMVLIGMSTLIDQKTGLRKDASKTPKKGQLGIVDKSFITEGEEGQRIAKVRVREIRIPAIGDKMASRSGQKGTVGMVIREADMPFTRNGIIPDIIVNPHAIPSRMTIGQFVECITGKACVLQGSFGDGTAFNNQGTKITPFAEVLTKHGYHSSGNELLYNGMTGEQLETEIFIGPTYYMRLKHMVKDKINYRTQGPRTALTRQPVSGRANDGGLRIGEMERDVLIAHGLNNMLTESMMERGDKYHMAVCNKTGMIAIYNPDKNLFLSPMADGPLKFVGSLAENNLAIENVSRFGRDFSIVRVPYSFKLLIQELQCANISTRIITEDNIEQIENMSFSKTFSKLLNTEGEIDMKKYINGLQQTVRGSGFKPTTTANMVSESPEVAVIKEYNVPGSPQYAPGSPAYAVDGSPVYNPNSPAYAVDAYPQYAPGSPAYAMDGSPVYNPNSPEYAAEGPTTPEGPPPPQTERQITGGGGSPKKFKIDDFVCKRGYNGDDNIWCVQDVGDEFYTIFNTSGTGSRNDMEIVDDSMITPYIPQMQPQMLPQMQPQNPAFNTMPYLSQKPPEVNITLVNGNNNRFTEDDKKKAEAHSGIIIGGDKSAEENLIVDASPSEKTEEMSGGDGGSGCGSGGGWFDFAKDFVIKKTL